MGKTNSNAKHADVMFMVVLLSGLFVFIVLSSYVASKYFLDDSQEFSSFSQFVQVKMTERSIRSVEESIVQAECQLPENYFAAKCQLAKSYVQSLWKDVARDKQVKNDGSATFSLTSSDKIPTEARSKIKSQLEQLRKEQLELKARLSEIKETREAKSVGGTD